VRLLSLVSSFNVSKDHRFFITTATIPWR
jgi:hypothetical protein